MLDRASSNGLNPLDAPPGKIDAFSLQRANAFHESVKYHLLERSLERRGRRFATLQAFLSKILQTGSAEPATPVDEAQRMAEIAHAYGMPISRSTVCFEAEPRLLRCLGKTTMGQRQGRLPIVLTDEGGPFAYVKASGDQNAYTFRENPHMPLDTFSAITVPATELLKTGRLAQEGHNFASMNFGDVQAHFGRFSNNILSQEQRNAAAIMAAERVPKLHENYHEVSTFTPITIETTVRNIVSLHGK